MAGEFGYCTGDCVPLKEFQEVTSEGADNAANLRSQLTTQSAELTRLRRIEKAAKNVLDIYRGKRWTRGWSDVTQRVSLRELFATLEGDG